MDKKQITFDTWNKVAAAYQDKFMDLDLYNDSYDLFCKLIEKQNPDILEIGCGPGNITRYLKNVRPDFTILATDMAPAMIELARLNNPGVVCEVMDCRQMDSLQGHYDGIVCGFCIPYLSKEECVNFLADSYRLLQDQGVLYFSTIKGDYSRSGFEKGSTGDSTFVYYYDELFFRTELLKAGFHAERLLEKDFPKADGTVMVNQIFIARKN